ncbi:hypothetical protein [Endozoicomonas sp. 8E]|uniref:hypothetical protein n=1 Tax=Endozoicomonas sp. 8E TaxID=3035692 RepID=UPI00293949EC|nr:hypothetical protein [Endozoicomonas sp. 8E]WOG27057.1 hypothetical protein P6910_21280 [Endozoicomonas sp. 8E]
MFGSGHSQLKYQPEGSSSQQDLKATTRPTGYFTHLMHTNSGDGNRDPQQRRHTLGLICFVYPCHGFCSFQPSFNSRRYTEWPLNSEENSTGQTDLPGAAFGF